MPTTLDELKSRDLPRCAADEIISGLDTLAEDDADTLRVYFRGFLAPQKECVGCGNPLGGIMGTFTWGIANGEGSCANCGYPARAYHRNVGPVKFLQLILQYHPSGPEEK